MTAIASAGSDDEPIDWSRFDSDAHRAAQNSCRHFIRCAVDGTTRSAVSQMLGYARTVGDGNAIAVTLAQLTGPCTLAPAPPDANGSPRLSDAKRQTPL
ncbi:hypothetical protein Q0Z83_110740 [Actinoplanes sichuanensis]|uniref:Uncharacterized protein n=1 Tax=Actinoplanes sichuanensis TaxID=512349 RepID=A0ABW4A2F8_9ACTN|nr:hypothetical protein [Actinoplanes sichuanensis]BEL12883.1 hypothetical protein Q0Z83_110740 [Actinoplanes sichuanensis]